MVKEVCVVPNEEKSQIIDFQLQVALWQSVEQNVSEILRSFKTCSFRKKLQDIFGNNIQHLFYAQSNAEVEYRSIALATCVD